MFRIILTLQFLISLAWAAETAKSVELAEKNLCPPIKVTGLQIDFGFPERANEPVLTVRLDKKQVLTERPVAHDPSAECRRLLYFPARKLIFLDFYSGQSGHQIASRYRSIYVFQIEENKLALLEQILIEESSELIAPLPTEPNLKPSGKTYEINASYSEPVMTKVEVRKDNKLVTEDRLYFEVSDKVTKTSKKYYY